MSGSKRVSRAIRKRAVGYVRVSSVRGREGDSFLSPDLQREKIDAWAAYRGYTVERFYVDLDESGRTMKRPEFERLMADARTGAFDAVVVYRLTRFARSVRGAADALAELSEHGVGLVSVSEDIDTTSASGKLTQDIFFALAEFESARIGEEWRNVHANRRRRGIANVTRPMLGYRVEGGTIAGVDEKEAGAVRLAFEWRAMGAGYRTIAEQLEQRGYRPKLGRKPGFSDSTLRGLFHNPHYAGLVRVADGEFVAGRHEALVSRELWEIVQATMDKAPGPSQSRKALLAGFIRCHGCGELMWRSHGAKPGQKAFRCSARWQGVKCPRPVTVRCDYVEPYVEEQLIERICASASAGIKKPVPLNGKPASVNGDAVSAGASRRVQALTAQIEEVNGALDALADLHLRSGGAGAAHEYERQTRRLLDERDGLLRELNATRVESTRSIELALPSEVWAKIDAEQAVEIGDLLRGSWPGLSSDEKRLVARAAIRQVTIHPPNPVKGAKVARVDGRGGNRFDPTRVEIEWAEQRS
jgi:DNA invertase Pin-like site-specific DNA recombinase